jgi:hypothetical protein
MQKFDLDLLNDLVEVFLWENQRIEALYGNERRKTQWKQEQRIAQANEKAQKKNGIVINPNKNPTPLFVPSVLNKPIPIALNKPIPIALSMVESEDDFVVVEQEKEDVVEELTENYSDYSVTPSPVYITSPVDMNYSLTFDEWPLTNIKKFIEYVYYIIMDKKIEKLGLSTKICEEENVNEPKETNMCGFFIFVIVFLFFYRGYPVIRPFELFREFLCRVDMNSNFQTEEARGVISHMHMCMLI